MFDRRLLPLAPYLIHLIPLCLCVPSSIFLVVLYVPVKTSLEWTLQSHADGILHTLSHLSSTIIILPSSLKGGKG